MKISSLSRHLLRSVLAVSVIMVSAASSYAQTNCMASKDVLLNPFNKNSAFHRPIGTGAQYASDSHATTRDWLKASRLGINTGAPWGVVVVQVDSSDPAIRIAAKGRGVGLPATIRLPSGGLKTTIAFNALGSTDGTVVIHDRSNGQTYELFQYDWNNGKPNASILRTWDIRGLGHGTGSGQRIGTTAAGTAMLSGALRGRDINESGKRIEHALQMVLPRRDLPNQRCNIMISRDIRLPATTRDGSATESGQNSGSIPYGALFALPRNVNINSLGLSEPGRRLAEAFQSYGIYLVDGGGCGNGAMRTDQEISSSVRDKLYNDMPKIYRQMRMVLNSAWSSGGSAVGGGQPIAPNCAFDAGATKVASAPQSSSASTPPAKPSNKANATPSTQQSSQKQTAITSGNRQPAPGTAAAANWDKAKQFYQWAMWDKQTMNRTKPGTAEHTKAKQGYERNSRNYVEHAAKAGIVVSIDTPPDRAFG